jgi:hypothetical protein
MYCNYMNLYGERLVGDGCLWCICYGSEELPVQHCVGTLYEGLMSHGLCLTQGRFNACL